MHPPSSGLCSSKGGSEPSTCDHIYAQKWIYGHPKFRTKKSPSSFRSGISTFTSSKSSTFTDPTDAFLNELHDLFFHFSNYKHLDVDNSKELFCLKKLCKESKRIEYFDENRINSNIGDQKASRSSQFIIQIDLEFTN